MSDVMFGPKHCRKCSKNHYPGPCPEPPPYVMPRIISTYRHHGLHPWAQPGDRPDRVWLLRFEDGERRDMIWDSPDAETRAREAYAQFATKWGCALFATVEDFPAENIPHSPSGEDASAFALPPDEPDNHNHSEKGER